MKKKKVATFFALVVIFPVLAGCAQTSKIYVYADANDPLIPELQTLKKRDVAVELRLDDARRAVVENRL